MRWYILTFLLIATGIAFMIWYSTADCLYLKYHPIFRYFEAPARCVWDPYN